MADFCMKGGCACGDVRYQLTAKPMFVHCCHCTECQCLTGSAFALNAMIESTHVSLLQGKPESITTPAASGNGQDILRCPTCRTAVWSHYAGAGDKISFVRVGALDDPNLLPPDIHIFTRSKQPWVHLPADTPAVDVYYDAKDYWPGESLARRKALFK